MIAKNIPSEAWAKVVAHAMFDGNINENPDKSGARVRFYSKDRNKLKEIQNILEKVCLDPYKKEAYEERNEFVLRYNNTEFTRKLIRMGAPSGDKITIPYRIPNWIKEGNNKIKIRYLSALIDDEAESIKREKKNTLRGLKIKQSKWIKHKKELKLFFKDIKEMFSSLNIQTGKITIDEKNKYLRKDNKYTITGWIRISLNKENQIKLTNTFLPYSKKIKAIID